MDRGTRWRKEHVAKGLCRYCSRRRGRSKQLCDMHLKQAREYMRVWERNRRSQTNPKPKPSKDLAQGLLKLW